MASVNRGHGNTDVELAEWISSLEYVIAEKGAPRVLELLHHLQIRAQQAGIHIPFTATTPYINSIPASAQPPYPGSREIERRIKSLVRWNAMAMVVRANREEEGIGGHISTYASAATLFEVGFNHFFRARNESHPGDLVYFQGHASPGIYARAYLEGRISTSQMENFRHKLRAGGGLPSYPHPRALPGFWQFPTVSMGLGPIMAIYQARFMRYLEHRGLIQPSDAKVWAFIGDGETDEPETLGAISLAAREKLDNLIFVINCNLQRLDGPVRGNGKIIQELEADFRGCGWNVIKVIWGSNWDPLLAQDTLGILVKRMGEVVDGQYQKYVVEGGAYIREHFFGTDPALKQMVAHLTDEQLAKLARGGHDPEKVYAAYAAAVAHKGAPTVILAKTIKGYGLGEAGEGRNVTHQQKKLNEEELIEFRTRLGIPICDEVVATAPLYLPPANSPEIQYLKRQREKLGGYLPERAASAPPLQIPADAFAEFMQGTDRDVSTTMAMVRIISNLMRNKEIGRLVAPIIPDEARTFGMEALFRAFGIYSSVGQLYEPVDAATLLPYREAKNGQILEEGITEAGAMSSFIAAGAAYSTYGINIIPFFMYYSMFGFQRIGDLVWAAADMRCRGFMVGATAGRTTLAGEGLQHQDGHSHLLAYPVPSLHAYDPAFAFEIALIVQEGMRRMFAQQEDCFYYITVGNEPYSQPAMPAGAEKGVLQGLYLFRPAPVPSDHKVGLLGSGAILNEVLQAQTLLAEKYGIAADVWSATSYKELYIDAIEVERRNLLHPAARQSPYVTRTLQGTAPVFVAASDYVRALPLSVARWVPGRFIALGTDGFGRSDSRKALRDYFAVDSRYIALAALAGLAAEGVLPAAAVEKAQRDLDINPDKPDPLNL